MKKFIQFGAMAILATTLAACDNANQSKPTTETKVEATLTPQEQFRHDYEAFMSWQTQTEQKFNAESANLQQKTAEHSQNPKPEELKQALNQFRNQVIESNKQLDALNLKDANINQLAQKIKEVYLVSIDSFDLIIQSVDAKDENKNMQAVQEKLQYIQKLQTEIQEMEQKLAQQYNQ